MKLDWSDMLLMVFVGWVAGMTTAAMLVHGDCSLRSKDAHYIQVLQDRGQERVMLDRPERRP
jgi:hypothetical protein